MPVPLVHQPDGKGEGGASVPLEALATLSVHIPLDSGETSMTSMAPQQHMQPRDQGRSARVVVVVLGRSVLAHLVDEGGHLFTCKPV